MKKRLLFVIPSLNSGGAEKSLITLLSLIDSNMYDIDLFIMYKKGLFLDMIPQNINVLEVPKSLKIFSLPIKKSIKIILDKDSIRLLIPRIGLLLRKFGKNKYPISQWSWAYISKSIPKITPKYDVAIGYLEGLSNYVVVDKVEAKKKIGWIHNDYKMLKMNDTFDRKYFDKLDNIVTVSEKCKVVLNEIFPEYVSKTKVIHNIVSPNIINAMALNGKGYDDDFQGIRILTVGRLNKQKGLDLAIPAFAKLISEGYSVKWYVIGEGEEKQHLEKKILDYGVEDSFILLGSKPNPYPYVKECDIYAQPSRFEGKSVAIDEAKILCKPILVTNFSTVRDQIEDGVEGVVVPINEDGIFEGVKKLITDNDLRTKLTKKLNTKDIGNEYEIAALYKLIEIG